MVQASPVTQDPWSELGRRVEDRIAGFLAAEAARWAAVEPDLSEPLTSLARLALAGGKRLRPAFCHWGFVGAGGDPDDPAVVDAGAALELLHCLALTHDDVMDRSPLRRGMPSVHADHADRHRSGGWRGESGRYGDAVAILVGDLAFVYADLLMAGCPPAAAAVFGELRVELHVGQYLDLLGGARGEVGLEAAQQVCLYKSAKYTVERPLHLGAALAGRLHELAAALSAYGVPVGRAFQLRDDLLGTFGDPARTGKPVGDDIRQGKPTTLYATALAQATGAGARLLAERFGAPDLSDQEIASLQQVLESTGARTRVEASIESLVEEALGALGAVELAGGATDALAGLARFAGERDR
ncbi:MAG: polyprenyl synthetase family protein [Acidimicrobiales bacterium]